jgi:hypothetical protein
MIHFLFSCEDFDLCHFCEEEHTKKNLHNPFHLFLKLYLPLPPTAERLPMCLPLFVKRTPGIIQQLETAQQTNSHVKLLSFG